MSVTFQDNIGIIYAIIDDSGISFDGTYAYFSDTDGTDYKVRIDRLVSVVNNKP